MKIALLALASLLSTPAFAGSFTVSCAENAYTAEATITDGKGTMAVTKNGQLVRSDEFFVMEEGFDSFLNAYVVGLTDQGNSSILGFALIGAKDLSVPGTYESKADIFINTRNGAFDGASVDCKVTIL